MNIETFKLRRFKAKISQKELAKEIGMNVRTLNLKENGKREFSISEVSKISKCLNLSFEDLDQIFDLVNKY